jgi:hypothetical protein
MSDLRNNYFVGSSSGCTYVSWNGPIACTCTSVNPRALAKWRRGGGEAGGGKAGRREGVFMLVV